MRSGCFFWGGGIGGDWGLGEGPWGNTWYSMPRHCMAVSSVGPFEEKFRTERIEKGKGELRNKNIEGKGGHSRNGKLKAVLGSETICSGSFFPCEKLYLFNVTWV